MLGLVNQGANLHFFCPMYVGRAQYFTKPSIKNPTLGHKSADFFLSSAFFGNPLPHPLRTSYMEAPLDASLSEQWRIVQFSGVCKQ